MIEFGMPQLFWALLLIPLFVALYIQLSLARRKALNRFGDEKLVHRLLPEESFNFRPLKGFLFILGYSFLVIALAKPRFGLKLEKIEKEGIDIMVALDVSKSMLAEDIAPNRIRRAKHEITKLIDLLKGDRIGLIVFAGESFVQTPLTVDYGAAKLFLDAVNTDWISAQGTDLSGAIRLAHKSFLQTTKAAKVLIIISDGEEQQGDAIKLAKKAAADGLTIYTVGVGSDSGTPIPIARGNGEVEYKKDSKGNIVMTRLNSRVLGEIALNSNAKYFNAGVNLNLTDIYNEISEMEKSSYGVGDESRYHDQYQLFLLIALLLFMAEFFLPDYLLKTRVWRGRFA